MIRGARIIFADVAFLLAGALLLLLIIVMYHVHPEAQASTRPHGDVIVEIVWPPDNGSDVDLWVQAPGGRPVGYSNKSGRVFNLLRDDLGRRSDLTPANFEVAYSRGMPDGEWTVNVHLYRGIATPVPVTARVSTADGTGGRTVRYSRELELGTEGDEITVVRFTTTDGRFDATSVHDLPKGLRAAP